MFQLKKELFILFVVVFTMTACSQSGSPEYVDGTDKVSELLNQERTTTIKALEEEITAEKLHYLIDLGSWDDARSFLNQTPSSTIDLKLAEAYLLMKQHRYREADEIVESILLENPEHTAAKLMQAKLKVQAWNLPEAADIANEILSTDSKNRDAGVLLGQIALLSREYDEALKWANQVQSWYPDFADSYILEAETQFWDQNPAEAEKALTRALELDPFNADARFSYGYAIWRRVDATQLDAMASQWNLAFELNPLHYLTHWHFGNGHTNLTYADYAHPSDSLVRARLAEADELIAEDRVDEAIDVTRLVEADYPESVLPAMMRGSAFYMHYQMDRETRLDSAEANFESVLERKQNYGPAHNGLAAVIKQRKFSYLDEFAELEEAIEASEIPEESSVFYDVFKDANYYPGDRVKKMINQQIGPSKAYLPMINKFNSDFAIPPLHQDLAIAMDRSYFRYGTTFDNRQWMDIRGVGSGATGIEYLERGSHLERNVLAHEYAHLYHGRILTDRESRRIRALYYAAKEGNYTLDYYANNNESEYFAQGYAGFLSEKKVHPLNHKSMNTKEYIRQKDPALYAFVDSLTQKQQAYLDGDADALADNWAQTCVSLADRLESDKASEAMAYLDTALTYNSDYLPAILSYAELYAEQPDFENASDHVNRAKQIDESYAPIYVTEANLVHQQALQGEVTFREAIDRQYLLFEKANSIETDLAVLENVNRLYRNRLEEYGRIRDAIDVALDYAETASTVSTYLQDRKEDALAYTNFLRSMLGDASEEVVTFFEELVAQNPQNFEYRRMYADVLLRSENHEEALEILQAGQRILESADNERADYTLRIAKLQIQAGDSLEVVDLLEALNTKNLSSEEQLLLVENYIDVQQIEKAESVLEIVEKPVMPAQKADVQYIKGRLAVASEDAEEAIEFYQSALANNPYHVPARNALIGLYTSNENDSAVQKLRDKAKELGVMTHN